MNSEHLSFRASPSLASALSEQADRAGCSVSEYLRSIARERVGLQSSPPRPSVRGQENPFALLKPAALGDLTAQRMLVCAAMECVAEGADVYAALDGLCYARLAAAHDQGNQEDVGALLALMTLTIDMLKCEGKEPELVTALEGEAIAIISGLADDGREEAADVLPGIVAAASRASVLESKCLSGLMAAVYAKSEGTA